MTVAADLTGDAEMKAPDLAAAPTPDLSAPPTGKGGGCAIAAPAEPGAGLPLLLALAALVRRRTGPRSS